MMRCGADTAAATRVARREFLRLAGGALGAAVASPLGALGDEPSALPCVTCFYQFGKAALAALGGESGLPNGPGHLHIFSHSHPGMRAHPDTANSVRALGSSFRYALALDLHKYPGWRTATDDQLKTWAREFRELALEVGGPADYFAFNEMPTAGAATPELRAPVIKFIRYLHDPGDGPPLRGVFYFTERNLNPEHWEGESDDLWRALDETCDLVIGEHYHSFGFVMQYTPEQLADHLFRLPRWLQASGKAAQVAVAERKYAVMHSSYYGAETTGWAGVRSDQRGENDLERYFRHLLAATRCSELGRYRIAFGPLATGGLDQRMLPILARVLRQDAGTGDWGH